MGSRAPGGPGYPWLLTPIRSPGRRGHGVASLSYDAAALRPSDQGAADAARPGGRRGQPDASSACWRCTSRGWCCSMRGPARRASARRCRRGPRRAQPAAAHRPAVHAGAAAGPARVRPRPQPRLGTPGYLWWTTWCSRSRSPSGCPGRPGRIRIAKKRKVYGCHIVLVSWTSDPRAAGGFPSPSGSGGPSGRARRGGIRRRPSWWWRCCARWWPPAARRPTWWATRPTPAGP